MTRPPSFRGMPSAPSGEGVSFALNQFMEAAKTNIEQLVNSSVIKEQLSIQAPKSPAVTSLSFTGAAVQIEGITLPTQEDVAKLAADTAALAQDVYYILQYLDTLVKQLRQ